MSTQAVRIARNNLVPTGIVVVVAVLLALAAFSDALAELVRRWIRQEEYGHAFFIPLIVLWMLWGRRDLLRANLGSPSWIGPLVILFAGIMHLVGELSAFFLLSQLGFVVALIGIVLGVGGYSLLRVTFVPIAFLLFAIPLPAPYC